MADQGWGDADDPAGGAADAGKKADADAQANVVQFPRDWIGPLDELVPIDLGPDPTAASGAGDAGGFWDGDISGERSVPEPDWDDGPRARAGSRASARPNPPPAARGRRRGLALSGGGLLLMAAVAVVLVATGGLGRIGGGATRRDRQVRTLTETVTAPATERTTADVSAGRRVRSGALSAAATEHAAAAARRRQATDNAGTEAHHRSHATGAEGAPEPTGATPEVGAGPSASATTGQNPGAGVTTGDAVSTSGGGQSSNSSTTGSACAQSPDSGCLP